MPEQDFNGDITVAVIVSDGDLSDNESTKRNRKSVITHFEKFCENSFDGRSIDTVIEDLILVSKNDSTQLEDLLQNYVSNGFNNKSANSIKVHYSIITRYLKYRGVIFDRDDMRTGLAFPRKVHEELVPMGKDVIRTFLDNASQLERAKLLVQATSGLRNQEVCGLRKKDIQTDSIRWTIHVNANIAKFKKSRITFLSNEAKRFLKPILDKLNPEDRIFVSNSMSLIDVKSDELQKFARLRAKIGLDEKYESSNRSKYTTHSLRSFFVTQAEKIHEGFGHALAGHERYMAQYERFTFEEKLNFYLEIEPSLAIYDNIDSLGKDSRISNLEKQVEFMKSYIDELTNRLDLRIKV